MSVLNTQQIMDILPHRSPFLLIDTVEELQPGVKCVAKKVVPGDTLELTTEIIKVKGPIGVGKAVARVNGKVACMAELTFAIG